MTDHNFFHSTRPIFSEIDLGSIYSQDEFAAVASYLEQHSNPQIGFSSSPDIIANFERTFAQTLDVKHAIAMANAGLCIDTLISFSKAFKSSKPKLVGATQAINYKAVPMSMMRHEIDVLYADCAADHINPSLVEIMKCFETEIDILFLTHMNGIPVEVSAADVVDPVTRSSTLIFEDCARSLGAKFGEKYTGARFDAGVHSFQSKKIITTLGEGGMITTNRDDIRDFALQFRQYGLENGVGTNFKMTEIQAVVGTIQLTKLSEIIRARQEIANRYVQKLAPHFDKIKIIRGSKQTSSAEYVLSVTISGPNADLRRDLIFKLMAEKYNIVLSISNPIQTFRWSALSKSFNPASVFSNALSMEARLFALPIHPAMTIDMVDFICDALLCCEKDATRLS